MEYSIENLRSKKESAKLSQKMNSVRKYEGAMLKHELVGPNGKNLAHYGRVVEENSTL